MEQDAETDPLYDPQEFDLSGSDHKADYLDSGSMLTEFCSRDASASDLENRHSGIEDTESDLPDTSFMSWEQPHASTTLPNEFVFMNALANEHPVSSGDFSGIIYTPSANPQFSDYLNQDEYFPLPVYPAGMPREEPVRLFGEMVSNATVLFDSANQGIQDAVLPRPIAPLDYNPGGLHPVIPYTIIPPEEMYQNRPPLTLRGPRVSACAQRTMSQEDGQQPLEPSQISMFQGHGQAPLFQGRGFQMPPLDPQPTDAEQYQEDYFWAQQHMELKRNQEFYKGGHLYPRLRSPLPDFDVELPLLDDALASFKGRIFPVPRKLYQEEKAEADNDQPSTPKPAKRQPIYGTPHMPQNVPMTYPPKQAKAHREDKRRRNSDFVFNKNTDFNAETSVRQLKRDLKEIAEDVKLNPTTTVSQPFSAPSVEDIGPFHYYLRDTTMAVRQRSDPTNLDSVRWEKRARASTMNKRSSPDAKHDETPSPGQDDSSSGQDSPTPKSKKARVELCTPSKKAPATTRSTSKKTLITKRTASNKAKCKDPSADRAKLQSPPIKNSGTRQPVPKSWEEASASDILLFELRKQGTQFPTIAKVLETTCNMHYLPRALRNRHWKIETRIGDMPNNLRASKMLEKKNDVTDKEKADATEKMDEETSSLSTPNPGQYEDAWYF